MRLLIDASNIRLGGGITHLAQLLAHFQPGMSGIKGVEVWSGRGTLDQLPGKAGVEYRHDSLLDGGLFARTLWQQRYLPRLLRQPNVDLLLSPGGTLPIRTMIPAVTMSQNMLPFEPAQASLFGAIHPMRLKLALLRRAQSRALASADGVIFLSGYAQRQLTQQLRLAPAKTALIPHGLEKRFFLPLRPVPETAPRKVRVLYVSILMPYKHQLEVGEAVMQLRRIGIEATLDCIGLSWGRYGRQVHRHFATLDPGGEVLRLRGSVPFERLHEHYASADVFVFASSCENLPNILLEAMASGVPIASSRLGPMPDVLGDCGVYFDPYQVQSITTALMHIVRCPTSAWHRARDAQVRAREYSWERCARETFAFLGSFR